MSRSRSRSGIRSPEEQKLQRRGRISFNNALRVVLVPSRGEYKVAGLNSKLWWDPRDYSSFQESSYSEILLTSVYENIDLRAARRKLYQPTPEELIESASSISHSENTADFFWDSSLQQEQEKTNNMDMDDMNYPGDVVGTSAEKLTQADSNLSSVSLHQEALPDDAAGVSTNPLQNARFKDSLSCLNILFENSSSNSTAARAASFLAPTSERDTLTLCVPLSETSMLKHDQENSSGSRGGRRQTAQSVYTSISALVALCSLFIVAIGAVVARP